MKHVTCTYCLYNIQSIQYIHWEKNVELTFKILISLPRRIWDLERFFLLILLMATSQSVFCKYYTWKVEEVHVTKQECKGTPQNTNFPLKLLSHNLNLLLTFKAFSSSPQLKSSLCLRSGTRKAQSNNEIWDRGLCKVGFCRATHQLKETVPNAEKLQGGNPWIEGCFSCKCRLIGDVPAAHCAMAKCCRRARASALISPHWKLARSSVLKAMEKMLFSSILTPFRRWAVKNIMHKSLIYNISP